MLAIFFWQCKCKQEGRNPVIRESTTECVFPQQHLSHLLQYEYGDKGSWRVRTKTSTFLGDNNNNNRVNLDGGTTSRRVACTIVSDFNC